MYFLLFCLFSTNTLQERGWVIGHTYIVHIVYNHGKSRKDHHELSSEVKQVVIKSNKEIKNYNRLTELVEVIMVS